MKRIFCILISLILAISVIGCGNSNETEKTDTKPLGDDKTVVVDMGEYKVYLDEVKYYAYTAQATYEVYFISEGKEINWNEEMKENVSWQKGVKSSVLDDMCRREYFYGLAKEYSVELSDYDKKDIATQVEAFFSDSSEKLKTKIGIKEERLKVVFEKAKIAEKVEEILTSANKNFDSKTYEKWNEGNTVTEEWQKITFDEPIFKLEDVN